MFGWKNVMETMDSKRDVYSNRNCKQLQKPRDGISLYTKRHFLESEEAEMGPRYVRRQE